MSKLAQTLSDIRRWWERRHPPLNRLPDWQRGDRIERQGLRRGCTQAIHAGRRIKREAVEADMRRALV